MRTIAAVARADLLERARRPGFLVTLVISVAAASYFLPPNHSTYITFQVANHRGLYGSAWIGVLLGLLDATLLSFAGFYLVRNAIEKDRRTGVGAILAATPITRWQVVLGKFASNLAVLSVLLVATVAAAIVMQLVRAEDLAIRPLALATPLLLIAVPVLALTAAVALVFEIVPWLRGAFGSVAYFFLWAGALSASATATDAGGPPIDILGDGIVARDITAAVREAFPGASIDEGSFSLGFSIKGEGRTWDLETFRFRGLRWTADAVASRFLWVAAALLLTLLAAAWFDRFESAGTPARERTPRAPPVPERAAGAAPPASGGVASLAPARAGFRPGSLLAAELRLALRSVGRGWRLVALGLLIACLFAPLGVARGILAPIAWVWPLTLWSALGTREARDGTGPLLLSSPHPLRRQLPAAWLAGAAVAALTGAGLGVRFALAGDLAALATWLAGSAFIPALALALGAWSGSSRLFEAVYLLLWYAGPLNHVPALDYVGATPEGVARGSGIGFAIAAAVLLALAARARGRRAA